MQGSKHRAFSRSTYIDCDILTGLRFSKQSLVYFLSNARNNSLTTALSVKNQLRISKFNEQKSVGLWI